MLSIMQTNPTIIKALLSIAIGVDKMKNERSRADRWNSETVEN